METLICDNIRIRAFTHDDKRLVEDFFNQMSGETRAFFDRNEGNRGTALRFFDKSVKHTDYFLAEYEGKMVGYVFLWDMDSSVPWLGIAVHDDFKGKKLGRKLMAFAVQYATEKRKGGILLTTHVANIRALALYERCGFLYLGTHSSGERLYLLRFGDYL